MNKLKKIISGALLLSLSLCPLVSCGQKSADTSATTDTDKVTDTTAEEEIITLPEYDFNSLDLALYIKLPEDYDSRDYSQGLTLKGEPTDKEILDAIRDGYLNELAEMKELGADGVVADLDTVIMDYVGKLDGVAFQGGSATDTEHAISLENSTFIDGFDRGLIGMKAGETKDLELTFPDPYPNNTSLAGKAVIFTVTIDKIIRPEYPALTDSLITENTKIFGEEIKTVAELTAATKKALESEYKKYNDELKIEAAWTYVTEESEYLSLPSDMLEGYKSTYLKSYEASAKQNSTTLEQYALANGYLSLDDFKEKVIFTAAENLLREKLVLYTTAKALSITVTEDEARELANDEFKTYIEPNLAYYTMYYGISDVETYMSYMGGVTAYKENLTFSRIVTKLCNIEAKE